MKQVASQRSLKPSSTRRTLVVSPTRINRIFNCGRWHLRATKIRQSRVVHSKSITNSITSPSKRKQKRSFSPNPSEQSSTADNYTSIRTPLLLSPLPNYCHEILVMSSSHGNKPPSIILDDEDDIMDAAMAAYMLDQLDTDHMGRVPQRNGTMEEEQI